MQPDSFHAWEGYSQRTTMPAGNSFIGGDLWIQNGWQTSNQVNYIRTGMWGAAMPEATVAGGVYVNSQAVFPIIQFTNRSGTGHLEVWDETIGFVDLPETAGLSRYDGWNTLNMRLLVDQHKIEYYFNNELVWTWNSPLPPDQIVAAPVLEDVSSKPQFQRHQLRFLLVESALGTDRSRRRRYHRCSRRCSSYGGHHHDRRRRRDRERDDLRSRKPGSPRNGELYWVRYACRRRRRQCYADIFKGSQCGRNFVQFGTHRHIHDLGRHGEQPDRRHHQCYRRPTHYTCRQLVDRRHLCQRRRQVQSGKLIRRHRRGRQRAPFPRTRIMPSRSTRPETPTWCVSGELPILRAA